MKTAPLFSFLALAALMFSPLAVMPAAAQADLTAAAEEATPRTGVRFVIVSPSGESLPSPLYCKHGKGFRSIHIGSRAASPRVRPEAGGVVRFWKEDPSAAAAASSTGTAKGGKKSAAASVAAAELPAPFLTVKLPENMDSKTLCILVPTAEGKAQTFFVGESAVPMSGVHLINFSPYPLQMTTSKKGDFSDKAVQGVSFFQRSEGISAKNSWSYRGTNGETVAFILSFQTPKDKEPRRVRASRFIVSERQSQITVVVKDPTREDQVKMLSVQLSEPTETSRKAK